MFNEDNFGGIVFTFESIKVISNIKPLLGNVKILGLSQNLKYAYLLKQKNKNLYVLKNPKPTQGIRKLSVWLKADCEKRNSKKV